MTPVGSISCVRNHGHRALIQTWQAFRRDQDGQAFYGQVFCRVSSVAPRMQSPPDAFKRSLSLQGSERWAVNILFLAPDVDLSRNRGDSVHVQELCTHLAALGHQIILLAGAAHPQAIPSVKQVARPDSTLRQILLGRRLALGWAEVIYERRLSPKLSWTISKLTRTPFVVEVNGVLEEEVKKEGRSSASLAALLRRRVRGHLLRRASAIVAVSPGIRDHFISTYDLNPARVVCIPNGANTDRFRPLDRESCREIVGVGSEDRVVCFVGNLTPWQGVQSLVRAIPLLTQEVPNVRLMVVGDGPEAPKIRALAASLGVDDVVRFDGDVPYEKVPIYLGAADVCVAPFEATRKASPIKVFEYMACGRAVVASDIDGLGRLLGTSGSGVAVPPSDVQALAGALARLLLNPREAEAMGHRGRDSALREGSWRHTAQRVTRVLESV